MSKAIPDLKSFLDDKVEKFNTHKFIVDDPISIPHRYELKEDIEIAGFMASTIAWGKRAMILKSSNKILNYMGNSPYDFVMSFTENDLDKIDGSVHRTFNSIDLKYFLKAIRNIYENHGGLESAFAKNVSGSYLQSAIHDFKMIFFELPHEDRTLKHIGDPMKGSAAKKINMFLRWMVRKDNAGVDFGIWNSISPSQLSCPLDVHSGNIARQLGLLTRKQNDAKALSELDSSLRLLDSKDPVKYDFALFGLGVNDEFLNL